MIQNHFAKLLKWLHEKMVINESHRYASYDS